MNWKFTLLLIAILAVLLVFAYTQRSAAPVDIGKGTPTGTPGPIVAITLDDLQEVSVVGATGSYTLTKVSGGWNVDGEKATTDVKDALTELVKLESLGTVPSGVKPEDYGFATPAMTVTLKTEAGASHVILVGDEVPGESDDYVRLQGSDAIYLMSNAQLNQLKDWLTSKPIQPTWTPTATPTKAGGTPVPPEGTQSTESGTPVPAPGEGIVPAGTPAPVVTIPLPVSTAGPTP